jgi:DNA polymerase (family 10)
MDNRQLASVFRDLARLLEYKGENQFKVRAYAKASLVIKDYHEELRDVVARGEDLRQIQGIGDAIALKIIELLSTGHLEFYDRVTREVPDGTLSLMNLPGIGPRTAARLAKQHGITSVEELELALRSAGPGGLPGIGAVTGASILKAIETRRSQ